jgi:superfamily II DNA or RNA helicase
LVTPYPWQERSIQHLLRVLPQRGAAVDASDAGTGKTLTAVEVIRRLGDPASVIVCPKSVIPGWHRTASAQGIGVSPINYEMVRTGRTDFGIWKGERFRWHPGIQFLVFDEAHRCKGHLTKNSELLKAARRQRIPTLALSATLADNPLELDALGYLLRFHDGEAATPTLRNPSPVHFLDWARRYGVEVTNEGPVFDRNPAHMAALNKLLFPDCGVRVRIADLGDAFPETQITAELCTLPDEDTAEMEALLAQIGEAWAALLDRTRRYGSDPLAQISEAHQKAELLMVPAILELAEDAKAQGRSVAIFVNYRRTMEELCRRLATDCTIDGSQVGVAGAARREENRLRFQRDEVREIICISQAGGVGLDLHDINGRFPRTALISPGFDAKLLRQIFGRVHRAGGKSKSLQRVLLPDVNIGRAIHRSVSSKLDNLDALQNGDLVPGNLVVRK